ncbi:MAG TPA: SRPBCC family protein [Nakamurella sp.]
MATPSSQSITVTAEPAAIMDVIADFTAYPEWAGAVKSVNVTVPGEDRRAKQVRFSMDAGLLKDTYELAYTWAADGMGVSWTLVSGQLQKSQEGSYLLKTTPKGTEVTYTLAVDLAVPMIGVLRRKAERVILDTALKELKKRVEAG